MSEEISQKAHEMTHNKHATKDKRRLGYFIPQQDGTVDIYAGVNVPSEEVLAELHEVVSVIFNLQPIIFAFDVVKRNYRELLQLNESCQSRLEDLDPALPFDISIAIDGFISFSQKVTNFLSSTSAFLAQTEMQLRRVYGQNSPEFNVWNEKRRNFHGGYFSYRFLYELRNFAQHKSIPFSSLNIAGERPSEELSMIVKIGVRIFRDGLLGDGYKWGKLQMEIQQQPSTFDLLPMVSEYMDCLRRLCLEAAKYYDVRLVECARYFDVICKRLNIPAGAVPVLFWGEPQIATPPSRYEIIPMAQFKVLIQKYEQLLAAYQNSETGTT